MPPFILCDIYQQYVTLSLMILIRQWHYELYK